MKIVTVKISRDELRVMAENGFGNLVKAVVDISKKIMVVNASLHADEEALLIQNGSKQQDLWGVNLYPEFESDEFIEFDSMINLRPSQGNNTRGVDSQEIQQKIREVIAQLVK